MGFNVYLVFYINVSQFYKFYKSSTIFKEENVGVRYIYFCKMNLKTKDCLNIHLIS